MKFLFLISLLFTWSTAQACKCDFSELKMIVENPTKAASAFVGVWNNGYFDIKKSWKGEPLKKIQMRHSGDRSMSKCDLNLIDGKEYVVVSLDKFKEGAPLKLCSTYANAEDEGKKIIEKLETRK
ncbi:MAG: hypothetical protein K2Q18_18245 [Bdellovibrionales bacterium]|nr:hypothetical protein [Bdellovibrionales bacterium]